MALFLSVLGQYIPGEGHSTQRHRTVAAFSLLAVQFHLSARGMLAVFCKENLSDTPKDVDVFRFQKVFLQGQDFSGEIWNLLTFDGVWYD